MTIEVGRSGGVFVPKFHSGRQEIASGASGTILEITPPAGERVRLTMFSPARTNTAVGLQLNVGGSQVCTGFCAGFSSQIGDWCVSSAGAQLSANADNENFAGYIPGLIGGVDESITVVATGANTSNTIYYGYQTGAIK